MSMLMLKDVPFPVPSCAILRRLVHMFASCPASWLESIDDFCLDWWVSNIRGTFTPKRHGKNTKPVQMHIFIYIYCRFECMLYIFSGLWGSIRVFVGFPFGFLLGCMGFVGLLCDLFLSPGLWRKGKVSPEDSAVVERLDRDLVRCQR